MQPTPVNPGGWNPNSQPTASSNASSLPGMPTGKAGVPGADSVTFGQRLALQQQNGWVQQMLRRLQLARAMEKPGLRDALTKQDHSSSIWGWAAATVAVVAVVIGIAGHRGGWWKKLAQSSDKGSRPPGRQTKPPVRKKTTPDPTTATTPTLTPFERLKADLAASPDAATAAIDKIEAEVTTESSRKELLQLAAKHNDLDVVQKAIGKFHLLKAHQTSLKELLESHLDHSNIDIQKAIIAQFDHITDLENLESLLKSGLSPGREASVATLATSKLSRMKPNQENLKALILTGLDHPHNDVKKATAAQFGHITDPVHLQPVLQKASQPTMPAEIATLAVNQFPRIQSEQAQLSDLILQGLQHSAPDVQKAAAEQFGHITDLVHLQPVLQKASQPAILPEIATLVVNQFPRLQSEQEQLKNLILQGMQHPDPGVRKGTISQLWHVHDIEWQTEHIAEALKDANPDIGDHALVQIEAHPPSVQAPIEIKGNSVDSAQAELFSAIQNKRNLLDDLAQLRQSDKEQINAATIQNLLKLARIEAETQAGLKRCYEQGLKPNNALHEAIRHNSSWALDEALKAGISPYARDEAGLLPLHHAAFHGNQSALKKVLAEMETGITTENRTDYKTLDDLKPEIAKAGTIAADFGQLETLTFLQEKYGNDVIPDELTTLAQKQAERLENIGRLKNQKDGTSLVHSHGPALSTGSIQNVEADYLETLAFFRSGWRPTEPDWSEGIVQSKNAGAIKAMLELQNFKALPESSHEFKDALAENMPEIGTLIPDQKTRMEIMDYALSTKDILGFPTLNAEKVATLIGQLETLIDDPGNRGKLLKQAFSATNESGHPLISAKVATQIINQLKTLVDARSYPELIELAQETIQNEWSISKAAMRHFRSFWGSS